MKKNSDGTEENNSRRADDILKTYCALDIAQGALAPMCSTPPTWGFDYRELSGYLGTAQQARLALLAHATLLVSRRLKLLPDTIWSLLNPAKEPLISADEMLECLECVCRDAQQANVSWAPISALLRDTTNSSLFTFLLSFSSTPRYRSRNRARWTEFWAAVIPVPLPRDNLTLLTIAYSEGIVPFSTASDVFRDWTSDGLLKLPRCDPTVEEAAIRELVRRIPTAREVPASAAPISLKEIALLGEKVFPNNASDDSSAASRLQQPFSAALEVYVSNRQVIAEELRSVVDRIARPTPQFQFRRYLILNANVLSSSDSTDLANFKALVLDITVHFCPATCVELFRDALMNIPGNAAASEFLAYQLVAQLGSTATSVLNRPKLLRTVQDALRNTRIRDKYKKRLFSQSYWWFAWSFLQPMLSVRGLLFVAIYVYYKMSFAFSTIASLVTNGALLPRERRPFAYKLATGEKILDDEDNHLDLFPATHDQFSDVVSATRGVHVISLPISPSDSPSYGSCLKSLLTHSRCAFATVRDADPQYVITDLCKRMKELSRISSYLDPFSKDPYSFVSSVGHCGVKIVLEVPPTIQLTHEFISVIEERIAHKAHVIILACPPSLFSVCGRLTASTKNDHNIPTIVINGITQAAAEAFLHGPAPRELALVPRSLLLHKHCGTVAIEEAKRKSRELLRMLQSRAPGFVLWLQGEAVGRTVTVQQLREASGLPDETIRLLMGTLLSTPVDSKCTLLSHPCSHFSLPSLFSRVFPAICRAKLAQLDKIGGQRRVDGLP